MQRELHQKLRSYQMIRAMTKGYMPSNEQVIVKLRTVLAADVLNQDNPGLSDSGRLLIRHTKQWLQQFIDLLQHKNSEDQIQDFIWYLSKSRISVDVDDARHRLRKAKTKANTGAGSRTPTCPTTLILSVHLCMRFCRCDPNKLTLHMRPHPLSTAWHPYFLKWAN